MKKTDIIRNYDFHAPDMSSWMQIRDLPNVPGQALPAVSGGAPPASVAQRPEQGWPRGCPGDAEGAIELFPEAGVWSEPRPWSATVYTSRRSESPLFASKGLVVDLLV